MSIGGDYELHNCTIVDNRAAGISVSMGGGVHQAGYLGVVDHCVLWGNRAIPDPNVDVAFGDQLGITVFQSGSVFLDYCDLEGGLNGIAPNDSIYVYVDVDGSNFVADPLLDADDRLTDGSPCINAGDRTSVSADAVDIDGEPRVLDCGLDVGADEHEFFRDCDGDGVSDLCQTVRPPPPRPDASADCDEAELVVTEFEYLGRIGPDSNHDGASSCDAEVGRDVWYRYSPAMDGLLSVRVRFSYGSGVVSAHEGCPGDLSNEIACDPNEISLPVSAGESVLLRITPRLPSRYPDFTFRLTGPPAWCAGCVNPGDCNANGVPDACDIADGTSRDDDGDGVPDECVLLCPGDIDGNLRVDLVDLTRVLSGFGATFGAAFEHGDLDFDGDVDMADLQWVLSGFGTECPR